MRFMRNGVAIGFVFALVVCGELVIFGYSAPVTVAIGMLIVGICGLVGLGFAIK